MDILLRELGLLCQLKVLGFTLFVASFGPPLPASVLLITAGAMIQQGHLSFLLVVLVGTITAIMGDLGAYMLARQVGDPVLRVLGRHRIAPAEHVLLQHGVLGIFLSRWLLTPVGPALNLICGLTRYPFQRFGTMIALGQLVWVIGYVLLGQMFDTQVQRLAALISDLSWLLVAILLGGVGLIVLRRTARARRMRHRAISVDKERL